MLYNIHAFVTWSYLGGGIIHSASQPEFRLLPPAAA